MGTLEALDAALAQHLGAVQRAAFEAPAGGGPAWDGVLRHYGVAALGADERGTIVALMHLGRGAVPAEMRTVLLGLQAWALRELGYLRGAGHAGHAAFASLEQRLVTLVDREMAAYERALGVAPPPPPPPAPASGASGASGAPSLASIFANAQSTSKDVPWANARPHAGVLSLTCVHCGGPQEQPGDFMCKYCRRPIAGLTRPTL